MHEAYLVEPLMGATRSVKLQHEASPKSLVFDGTELIQSPFEEQYIDMLLIRLTRTKSDKLMHSNSLWGRKCVRGGKLGAKAANCDLGGADCIGSGVEPRRTRKI